MDDEIIGYILAGVIDDLLGAGPHTDNYNRGVKNLKQASAIKEIYYINRAIEEFIEVDDSDRLFLRVASKYMLSLCYCAKNDFDEARDCVRYIKNVNYDFFTRKKDTIEMFRSNCDSLNSWINECEEEYIRSLVPSDPGDSEGSDSSVNWWKVMAIIMIVLFVLIGIAMLIYHLV